MPYPSTETLAGLIERKHACLTQLRALGNQQMELVEAGEMTELLRVLAGKQQLIQLLQDVEQQLAPFRQDDPDQRHWPSPTERARCAAQAEECQRLLDDVLRQEKQSETRLTARRDEVARQLQGVHHAHQARHAYSEPLERTSGMLDLSSEA